MMNPNWHRDVMITRRHRGRSPDPPDQLVVQFSRMRSTTGVPDGSSGFRWSSRQPVSHEVLEEQGGHNEERRCSDAEQTSHWLVDLRGMSDGPVVGPGSFRGGGGSAAQNGSAGECAGSVGHHPEGDAGGDVLPARPRRPTGTSFGGKGQAARREGRRRGPGDHGTSWQYLRRPKNTAVQVHGWRTALDVLRTRTRPGERILQVPDRRDDDRRDPGSAGRTIS